MDEHQDQIANELGHVEVRLNGLAKAQTKDRGENVKLMHLIVSYAPCLCSCCSSLLQADLSRHLGTIESEVESLGHKCSLANHRHSAKTGKRFISLECI